MCREKFYQRHVAQSQLGQPLHILETLKTAELVKITTYDQNKVSVYV